MVSFKRWNLGIQKNPFRVVFLVSPVSRGLCGAGTMLGLSLKALAMRGLSPVALSGPTLQLWCLGFPSWRLLFLQNTGSGAHRLWGTQASAAVVLGLSGPAACRVFLGQR